MAYFQTKNPNLGKFWRHLQQWKVLVYFTAVSFFYGHLLYIFFWRFGTFYGYLVYFSPFLYFLQEKSGNPADGQAVIYYFPNDNVQCCKTPSDGLSLVCRVNASLLALAENFSPNIFIAYHQFFYLSNRSLSP
jgi:hypothetical protein